MYVCAGIWAQIKSIYGVEWPLKRDFPVWLKLKTIEIYQIIMLIMSAIIRRSF